MFWRDGADSVVVFVDDNVVVESRTVATPFSRRLEAASSQTSIGTASNNEEEIVPDESNLSPLSSRGGCNVDVNDEAFITELNYDEKRQQHSKSFWKIGESMPCKHFSRIEYSCEFDC